jgi:hypothetical protein
MLSIDYFSQTFLISHDITVWWTCFQCSACANFHILNWNHFYRVTSRYWRNFTLFLVHFLWRMQFKIIILVFYFLIFLHWYAFHECIEMKEPFFYFIRLWILVFLFKVMSFSKFINISDNTVTFVSTNQYLWAICKYDLYGINTQPKYCTFVSPMVSNNKTFHLCLSCFSELCLFNSNSELIL